LAVWRRWPRRKGDDAAAINSVRQQLQALKVTGRQTINLDPDEVRVRNGQPSAEGEYTLWAGPQPTDITCWAC
jgi:hypothetical protein